jgi:hypothetical protein
MKSEEDEDDEQNGVVGWFNSEFGCRCVIVICLFLVTETGSGE